MPFDRKNLVKKLEPLGLSKMRPREGRNNMGQWEEIQERIRDMVQEGIICGASYGFAGGEEGTFYAGVQGALMPWSSRRLEPGMLYDLASLTKVVGTTSRILQCIQEGSLSLSTRVSEVLEKFRFPDITVEHLLLHNSGLPAEIPDKRTLTADNILERLYLTEPESRPGERFCYSDPGYILLGLMIEAADGKSLEESLQDAVFKPLGMKQTSYHPAAAIERFVPEECTEARGVICGEVHDSKAYLLGESGSAGLFSTLDDLMIFAKAYVNRDSRLFGQKIFDLLKEKECFGRTLGWSVEYGPHTLYHTGFTGTSILLDMERRQAFILLTNRIHPTRENSRFLECRRELNEMWRNICC